MILQSSQDEPGSFIAAWDAASGKQLWKNDLKGGQHAISTPCFLADKDGLQLVSLSTDNGLLGLDPATGKGLWSVPDIFKLPFVLYFEGYKYNEIAENLKEPLGTIKSRIHFARKLLKEQLSRI